MSDSRFLILVLDGLRPDLVTREIMPNLSAFRDQAAVLENSRSQFPTHTRVNKTSLATGSTPHHHGVHFNKIFDASVIDDQLFDIGDYEQVARLGRPEIVLAPTIGAVLAPAGKRFALVHCGATGAPGLLNYKADVYGHEHLSLAGYEYSTPLLAAKVEAALGDMPSAAGISPARSRFAFQAFTDVIHPDLQPDVTVIWSDEPDKSLHVDGLGGPVSRTALAHADALVGEAVAWWRAHEKEGYNLIILSDHGHIETSDAISLDRMFAQSNLPVTTDPAKPGALLLPWSSGGIYLRGQSEAVLADIVAWMQQQPWCGHLFTSGDAATGPIPGTLSTSLVSVDHPRAPDLFFVLRRTDGDGVDKLYGNCLNAGDKGPAGSTHGGLHREELSTVTFAAGPDFRANYRSQMVGGMIDIFPTLLHRFGIAQPETMVGRPLDITVDGVAPADALPAVEQFTAANGGYVQHLSVRRLARRQVPEHAWLG
ncbi:MAG TPA: alkaline phosphatase family protein [Devosiaceae bacterium]|jgi:arylsulfatase A-like enzyme